VLDFGKFLYEREKKEREAKKAQVKIEIKEIRLRPKTNEHHRGFKVDDARRWLLQGHKVRVTVKFRGREMDYPEIALEDLREVAQSLSDVGVIEQAPMMEGRTMLVVIGPEGENVGVVPVRQALQIARDADLDLVEVSPNAAPPVCRVLDFGKFLYEREKKEREAKKAQVKIEIKEIRLRPKTNEHHRGFKVDDARRWLLQGHKVRVTVKFRGREMDYPEIALEDLKEIAQSLSDVGVIEQAPMMEGRTMLVVMGPSKAKAPKKPEKGEQQAEGESEAAAS